jgi:methionyl-tRNA formyltransferase
MLKKDLKIIFLGNPEFAKHHLQEIINNGFRVVAVVSAPDRPAGRGMKFHQTPVTAYAKEKGIPCLQPTNLKNPDFQKELKSYNADIQVVIAFRMLPQSVWDMPPLGTLNVHASLLPNYRGAAPINWAIINGETKTGVSTFKLQHEIDTGNLIIQKECDITATEDMGSLHDKLMYLGAEAILETLDLVVKEDVKEIPQIESSELKNAPKIFPETTLINWDTSCDAIDYFVRGLRPYPVAKTVFDNKNLKIYSVSKEIENHQETPGQFYSDQKSYIKVSAKDGFINLQEIQLQGKRKMSVKDLLNGYDISHLNLKPH